MIDLSNVQFMTTEEGIKCAYEIKIPPHMFGLIYIHRYDVGCILGLASSDKESIEWKRLLDIYNRASSLVLDPGFSTAENKSSSTIPSQYELQIPEYIRRETIYQMGVILDKSMAKQYRQYIDDITNKVIPLFEQNTNPKLKNRKER